MDSSSDLTLSSDWDVINCSTDDNKIDSEERIDDILTKDEMTNVAEKIKEPKGTGVHDIPELESSNHNESSSSSEFDVIEETADENHSNVPISSMEFSLSASLGENHISPVVPEAEPESELEQPVNLRMPVFNSFHLYPHMVQRIIIVVSMLVVILGIYFSASDSAKGTINHMKDRMSVLQAENIELKNQMRSKFENNKMLMALEEQIKALKDENFKLSSSMQALVLQLEEQTAILKKEKETKMQDPYRGEIEKLKEHISKLQSDNVAFQDQIEGIRYGILSPVHLMHLHYIETHSEEENEKLKEKKLEQNKNHENSSEKLAEKLNELKKNLDGELDRLKNWKKSVQQRVKEMDYGTDESHAEDESQYLENKYGQLKREEWETKEERKNKYSEEEWGLTKEGMELSEKEWKLNEDIKPKVSERGQKPCKKGKKPYRREQEFSQKGKKPYRREQEFSQKGKKPSILEKEPEWSWNILKKNLKGTIDGLPKINVPDMLSKYVDKKRVENVFESVGHYFKKAQEKTKKILNYNNEGKDHFWNFLGDLRKKWSDIKDDFFENNCRKSADSKAQFSTDIPSQSEESSQKKFKKPKDFETHGKLSEDFTTSSEAADREESIEKSQHQNEGIDAMTQSSKDTVINWFLRRNRNDEDLDALTESDKDAVINWFLRRNKNDEDTDVLTNADKVAVINWYLKRNKNDDDVDDMTSDKDVVINWFLKRNKKDEYIDAELREWMVYWSKYQTPSHEE